jgi:hypothetical protein
MPRITTALINKRETFAYNQLSLTPPASIASIQTTLKDPAAAFGGKTMASKRLYEIRALVASGQPRVDKVNKHEPKTVKPSTDTSTVEAPTSVEDSLQSEVPEFTSESSEVPDMFK